MSTNSDGVELGQAARTLFNSAADYWYVGGTIQIFSGLLSVYFGVFEPIPDKKIIFMILTVAVAVLSYYLKIISDDKQNKAETMRRQAAFTEGLNWPINKTLKSDWLDRAGLKNIHPRENNYYSTNEKFGARKMLDMTIQSAFFTRHLYARLNKIIRFSLFSSIILSVTTLSIIITKIFPESFSLKLTYFIYLFIPVLVSIDLLGTYFQLNNLKSSILEIEKDMERLSENRIIKPEQVVRLVSEYNCQLACGFPIHNLLFQLWHDEIEVLWKHRDAERN